MINSQNSEQKREQIESIISIRTQMLMAVFGKRENDDLIAVFKRHLNRYSERIVAAAFSKAESELERFPTVRAMVGICETLKPSGVWKYNYKDDVDQDGVPCKIDPETKEKLYLPQNCKEGREFLRALAKIAGKKSVFDVDLEASAANLQAQKIAILKQQN